MFQGRARRARVLPVLALVLAAVASALAGAATSASAAVTFTSSSFYLPLSLPPTISPPMDHPIAGPSFYLQAGETRRVTDQLDVALNGDLRSELNNAIFCDAQDGTQVNRASSGTNYPGVAGVQVSWQLSMLLTAPQAGYYTCGIVPQTSDGHTSSYQMTLWPPDAGHVTGTWLRVSSADEAGAKEWDWPHYYGDCPTGDTTEQCWYIGGHISGNTNVIDMPPTGETSLPPSMDTWTAASDATTIDAVGTFQLTTCPSGSGSCPAYQEQNGQDYATLQSRLDLDQLYPDGSVCVVNTDYGTARGQSASQFTVTTDIHHMPLSYHVSAPVSQNCGGSRTFKSDLHFQWLDGVAVKLDGGNVNVINSVRATATTVPGGVIGGTEAQADAAIQAAQLTVIPSYVMSAARAGTVLSENSPAGTVEPAGSPVQISISLGQASVPHVIGDDSSSAMRAITNAGLTVGSVSHVNNCVDPGSVLTQDPSGGVIVSLGSTVDIQVSTCNSGGGCGGGGGGSGGGGGGGRPPILPK